MSGKLYVVVGGQYGSEGKGAVAGRVCKDLSEHGGHVVGVRVGGPNAGHTVIGRCPPECKSADPVDHEWDRHPWRLRQVPVSAVTVPTSTLVIAAGSEIDPDVLDRELVELDGAGYDATPRLLVDRNATVIEKRHVQAEQRADLTGRIGSTGKGIGSARADRVLRSAQTWDQYCGLGVDTAPALASGLRASTSVVIEGTQGYGLGLHTRMYPFATSGDCRAIDFLAAAGLSPWSAPAALHVVVCLRPYPIRVAGNSGPLKDETTWDNLGLPVEHTTVTNKVRRVGGWDSSLARDAVDANGGPREGVVWLALTMMDSIDPELAGRDENEFGWDNGLPLAAHKYLDSLGMDAEHLGYIGTGPDTALVNERMYD